MNRVRPVLARMLRITGYVPAVTAFCVAALLHVVFLEIFGPRFFGITVAYLLALLVSAWCGYGPGILTVTLIVAGSPYLSNNRVSISRIGLRGVTILLPIALLVSTVSARRRKTETALRLSNAELDERVRRHTTQLEEANRELASRLAELETLYGELSAGVCFLDRDLRFVRLNRHFAESYGISACGQAGRPLGEVLPPSLVEVLEPQLRCVLETGQAILDHEFTAPLHHDRTAGRDWLARYAPVTTAEGDVVGVQLLIQDITERNRFDEKLRHAAKFESLGVLAGGIAHDFNNLLTGIIGNAALARGAVGPTHPACSMLDRIVHSSERAANLTRQMLAYAGKIRMHIVPVDIGSLLAELRPLIDTTIPKTVEVSLELQTDSRAAADSVQLRQLILNLLTNAAEAIPEGEGGKVTVRTCEVTVDHAFMCTNRLWTGDHFAPGEYVCLEIEDSGVGMDSETMDRIFDPFFSTKFTGRGLGLAATMGIVRSHDGALSVASRPGKGTIFRVLLPKAVPQEASQPVAASRA